MNILSPSEHVELLSQHKKERDSRICDRIKVLLWYSEGKSIEIISNLLYLSQHTIRKHIKDYKEEKKLKPSNGGSESKLSEMQGKELSDHLENKIYTTVQDISDYIIKTYRIKYSNSGLTNWLHSQDFTYKKPKGIPSKLNEESQAEFILKYNTLEKDLLEDEEILFMDSCHPTQATKFGYGWIKKGKEKQIKTTASRTRLNITGAINIKSREVITKRYETINSENTIDFFKKVLLFYPKAKKINIIADGAAYHKSQLLKEFITDKKIEIHILPPYSPNLNPIERLWKIMNEYVRNNRHFENAKEFREAIDDFFSDTIPRISEKLYSRINSNFQIIKNTS